MAPLDADVEAAREWLGAEHGGITLDEELQDMLVAGFEAEKWTTAQISLMENLTAVKAVEVFKAVLEDSAEEAGETPTRVTVSMFKLWIQAHFEEDGDGSDVPKKYVPSKEEQDDLDAMGMESWLEMRHGEYTLFTGRPGSDADVEGGEYRTSPVKMKGVMALAKLAKNTGGFRNYDTVLREAEKSGNVDALEKWITKAGFALSKRSSVKHTRPGSIMLSQWMRARRQFKDDRALIRYMKEYREETEGRFFPKEIDMEIVGVARDSYQAADSGKTDALEAQLREVLESNREMKREIQSLTSRVRTLQANEGTSQQFKGPPGGPNGSILRGKDGKVVKCFFCEGNHYRADCPDFNARTEDAEEEASASQKKKKE